VLTSICFTNFFYGPPEWAAAGSSKCKVDSRDGVTSAEQPHEQLQNTTNMSLNIPSAPNAGLFKQGYNK
jgi:hypothetical protein